MSSTSQPNAFPQAGFGVSRWLAPLLCCCSLLPVLAADSPNRVDFNFQIRPVLADKCFTCHGPDARTRKAKLRLDMAESALAIRDPKSGTRAVVPGHPEQSELYRRITATDEKEMMPPATSKFSLDENEKELLRRWIAEGAEYKTHWAFIPVTATAVPAVQDPSPAINEIDHFVISKLAARGLALAKEATRETLIRRLSFDLRGLPPSLAEIDEFVRDGSPDAYEKLVDRLLASPAYGERQANEWLDLARYADTFGYQADVEKDLSPWRDWVIDAFNRNLPYDQFLLWQLAGDLLPNPTREQVLATAFNRLHRQTNEGGSIDEEFRVEYVADRVQTASTAMLGLTMGCARCHDHKYDPISQKDFYRLSAFFDNIDESGLYSHFTMATPTPTLLLYPTGAEAIHHEVADQIREVESQLETERKAARTRFESWRTEAPAKTIEVPQPLSSYSFEQITKNTSPDSVSTNTIVMLSEGPEQTDGKQGHGLRFSGDNSAVCKGGGKFDRTTPFSFSLWLKPDVKQERAVIFHRSRAWSDSGSRGYELVLEEGRPAFGLIHFWPGNAIRIRARDPIATGQWSHLAVTYDGSSHAAGLHLFLNGALLDTEVVRDNLYKDILHRSEWGDAEVGGIELTLAGRFRDSGFKNGIIDEFKIYDRCLTSGEVRLVAGETNSPSPAELSEYYLGFVDPGLQQIRTRLEKLRQQENALINDVPEIMVMKEMTPPRHTYLLKRGAYDARGEEVQPGTPEGIFPFPKEFPTNRLGLARWMIDPRNPLTARVAVNRAWRMHFGRGIVVTEEDFGIQGRLPTHPELLDWLANWFLTHGWNLKQLHKLIVLSATYRQTSVASHELLAQDPENQWLARGPKQRLAAEQVRDNALSISGLLVTRVGGRSVKPYQPEGLWEEAGTGKHYEQDRGEGLYRRSLYTFWRRTAPPPSLTVFDAPSREVCTARRETTTTPLQALVLLNDPQFLEAARVLAERAVRDFRDDVDARITWLFRLATGREPQEREREVLRQLLQEQRAQFKEDPKTAESYLSVGTRPREKGLPIEDTAATAVLASTLMNLDEFVMKR